MQPVTFIADSPTAAVTQIREQLGPEAVVLNVRRLPAPGVTRLWKRPRIEVLAYRPEATAPPADLLAELRQELADIKQSLPRNHASTDLTPTFLSVTETETKPTAWRVATVLESTGLLPLNAQRVVDRLQSKHGDAPPPSLAEELVLTRDVLARFWRQPPGLTTPLACPHVLVGPAGVGKTTCLCKWLTHAALVEGRSAQVWRLDGATANTAESLSVYCEVLGVPIDRSWRAAGESSNADLNFIDLPGVEWRNARAIQSLAAQVRSLGPQQVHLILNAAYEVPMLLAQMRAFAPLGFSDLILTHLDEESRWGKIWNLLIGTNGAVRFFSLGQNVPGEFVAAAPERIFERQFPA